MDDHDHDPDRRRLDHHDLHHTAVMDLVLASRTVHRYLQPAYDRYAIPRGRDRVLMEIARLGTEASPKRLCRNLWLTPASLATVLRRAETAGYLVRRADPHDGRSRRIELTVTGRACAHLMAGAWWDAERLVEERLGRAGTTDLRRLARAATAALEAVRRSERGDYFPGARPLPFAPRPGP